MSPVRRRILVLTITVVVGLLAFIVWRHGRSLWMPLVHKVAGAATVEDRCREIATRHPDLVGLAVQRVRLIAIKDAGILEVQINDRPWRSFPWTAGSGGPGPKLRQGDRQIPEGLYRIDTVNPNSAYHLSLRVSYPNAEDRQRSAAQGITDLGGDIYIHGKDVSIGCIAIGDDAIEQVFYVVNKALPAEVPVLIMPFDLRLRQPEAGPNRDLYERIRVTALAWSGR
jgi:hypothetical protein